MATVKYTLRIGKNKIKIVFKNTFVNDWLLACMVANAAQQTRALELERPALLGIVPSTTHCNPLGFVTLQCSNNPFNPHRK